MANKTEAGIARVFKAMGLPVPTGDRMQRLIDDGRSYSQIRDDLFKWGQGQGGDTHANMVKSMVKSYFDQFGVDYDDARIDRIAGEIASGERSIDEVRNTIKDLGSGGSGGEPGDGPEPEPDLDAPGIMPGGETIKVGDQWYQIYEFPPGSGEYMTFQFNNRAQVEEVFGEVPPHTRRSAKWLEQHGIVEADAEELIGETRDFHRYTQELMEDAARAAGIRDPSLAGRIAADPEMQQIMAQAIAGDWTAQQILAEQRQTDFWKNELYPGIENFYDRTDNPEKAWVDYNNSMAPYLEAMGYERDADGTFKSHIQRALDQGIDAGTFAAQAPTFLRAIQNADFAEVLNEWAEQELGRSVEFGDWFDLMAGESAPELDAVAEKATLAYAAQQQGSGLTDEQIRRIADETNLSEAQARQAFSEFNQGILALGNEGLSRYGLNRDEVLSAAAGITPESGRSVDEVKLLVAKTARELALFDDEKINFYVGFNQQGQPVRPGLQSLSPEGA